MDTSNCTTPLKQCSKKENCVHPEAKDGWLPATPDYFTRLKHGRYGVHSRCRACDRVYRDATSERRLAQKKQYYREKRETILAKEKVYRSRPENNARILAYQEQYRNEHREHIRARDRAYNATKRDKEKERRRSVVKNSTRRAHILEAGGVFTKEDVKLLYRSQKGRCWWCGKPVGKKYHVDHRIPLSRGGSNAPENLCIACPQCNISKGSKLPHEWNGRLL